MDRRALLSGAGGLALGVAAAGCLAPVQLLNGGPIRPAGGMSALHRADRPFLSDDYRTTPDEPRRAWLADELPPDAFYHPTIPADERRALSQSLRQTDFESQFVLVVEVRMPADERYFLNASIFEDARWTGVGRATLPVRQNDAADVEDPSFEGADELACTALVRFEADTTPTHATVEVYDEQGGQRGEIPAERL